MILSSGLANSLLSRKATETARSHTQAASSKAQSLTRQYLLT